MNDLEIAQLAQGVERMSMSINAHDEMQALIAKHGGWPLVLDVFEQSTDTRVRRLGFTLRAAHDISRQAEVIADRLRMDEQYFVELSARASVFSKRGRLDEASEYIESVASMLCILMEQILRSDPTDEAAKELLEQWREVISVMQTR